MKLSDIEISFISLVKSPANEKELIFKSGDKEPNFEKELIIKSLSSEGVAYGIVYSPYEKDLHGDWSDEVEIRKSAHAFMKNKRIDQIDREHSFKNVGAWICESWIIKSNDDIFENQRGAWAVGIKIEDENLKELIAKGEITGLSMAGYAKKENLEIPNLIKGETMAEETKKPEQEPKQDENLAKVAELQAQIEELQAKIEALSAELKGKDEKIGEIEKSHKAELVERIVKSGEMLPSRKDTALSLSGQAFKDYLEVCKSEAEAILKSKEFSPETKKSDDIDEKIKKQLGL